MRLSLLVVLLAAAPLAAQPVTPDPSSAWPSSLDLTDFAYVYDVIPSASTFESFQLNAPAAVTDGPNVAAPDGSLIDGCDFDNADLATLICVTSEGQLFTVDVASGAVGPIGMGSYVGAVSDLTYSVADDTWYALVSDCTLSTPQTSVYIVDPATGAATLLNTSTDVSCGFAIAAAPDGALYGYSAILDRRAYRIDPQTGAFTILGVAGIPTSFSQSMDCDASTGECYAFAFTSGETSGLYAFDRTTGRLTLLGAFPGNPEYTAGAIAAVRAPVTSEAGPSGTVALDLVGANPVHKTARLGVRVEAGQRVRVRVYDALGREVARLHDGPVPAGRRLDLSIDTAGWAAGSYLARLDGDGVALSRAFTVTR